MYVKSAGYVMGNKGNKILRDKKQWDKIKQTKQNAIWLMVPTSEASLTTYGNRGHVHRLCLDMCVAIGWKNNQIP